MIFKIESSEDMRKLYKETIEKCIKKNGISETCADSLNTGKIEKDCLESCTNTDCMEKIGKCISEVKQMKGEFRTGIF